MKKTKSFVRYDAESDTLYIITGKGEEKAFVEVVPGVNVELDENGKIIGIEILNASRQFKPVAKPLYEHMQVV